jgi:hypothetical protein
MAETMTHSQQVAATILEQMGGMGKLRMMIGANNFVAHATPAVGVSFRFKGSRKANYCKVTLTGMDTYNFTLGKIRDYALVPSYELTDVYSDMLMDIFEQETGLYLTFNARR